MNLVKGLYWLAFLAGWLVIGAGLVMILQPGYEERGILVFVVLSAAMAGAIATFLWMMHEEAPK